MTCATNYESRERSTSWAPSASTHVSNVRDEVDVGERRSAHEEVSLAVLKCVDEEVGAAKRRAGDDGGEGRSRVVASVEAAEREKLPSVRGRLTNGSEERKSGTGIIGSKRGANGRSGRRVACRLQADDVRAAGFSRLHRPGLLRPRIGRGRRLRLPSAALLRSIGGLRLRTLRCGRVSLLATVHGDPPLG